MDVDDEDRAVSAIAAAIGEPARARMLFSLMDDRARTSTELAVVAGVSPSTASVHLARLRARHLVQVMIQGKHRYYRLQGADVASALEALSVVAGAGRESFTPTTPSPLRTARTCYDHLAGNVGVGLHDRFIALGWLTVRSARDRAYDLTAIGAKACAALGIDVDAARALRRQLACACLDWSERRPHIGGALGAALLSIALRKKWLRRDLDSRVVTVTDTGRREMRARFGLTMEPGVRKS